MTKKAFAKFIDEQVKVVMQRAGVDEDVARAFLGSAFKALAPQAIDLAIPRSVDPTSLMRVGPDGKVVDGPAPSQAATVAA